MRKTTYAILTGALTVSIMLSGCGSKQPAGGSGSGAKIETTAESKDSTAVSEADASETEKTKANIADKTAQNKSDAVETSIPKKSAAETLTAENLSPDEKLTLQFASEVSYIPSAYPDLAKRGNFSEVEADQVQEGVQDLILFDYNLAGIVPEYTYYGTTSQSFIEDWDDTRIVEADSFTGDELLDPVMKKVGYSDYTVSYYYTHSAWRPAGEELNAPVLVTMNIDGRDYEYYFAQHELVRRVGPDGTQDNPETNDFMNNIYKVGCYYGNVLLGEKNRYALFLTSLDAYAEKENQFEISTGIQGREGSYTFVVDEKTDFSPDCETAFFSGYEDSDKPIDWMKRAYAAAKSENGFDETGIADTALLGIMDVKTSGNHVDTIYGTYWWD